MTTGVRWLSIGPGSGYGDAGAAYRSGLRAAGVPVMWTPLGWPSPVWGTQYGPLEEGGPPGVAEGGAPADAIDYDKVVVHSTPLWHARLRAEAGARPLFAFTTWETDRLPDGWIEILNHYDGVIVPSRFNATVFERSGVEAPVRVVPHMVPKTNRAAAAAKRAESGTFVFYVIATWTSRKAIPDAIRAFLGAFTADDDVALVIQTTPEDLIAQARAVRLGESSTGLDCQTWFTLARLLSGRASVPRITLGTCVLTREEIAALHQRCDCFVLLSHGEGWGLGAFEAASAGNPVVVTGWGGTPEFMPSGYPYYVDYDLVPTATAEPDMWWVPRPRERWANARVEHAAEVLRHVYEHREEVGGWGRALQSHVREAFSEPHVTRLLLDALAS